MGTERCPRSGFWGTVGRQEAVGAGDGQGCCLGTYGENVMTGSRTELAPWDIPWLCRLVVDLRRHGVPVHEARVLHPDAVAISFEPNLGQAQILEGLLLATPGVVAVRPAGERVVQAYRQLPAR
ncbi:hypothetical protein Kisp02_59250 [Kineosporia sp. NBRC 101731]|nr:hypothetical protein Kisp02_59250 [Kineosporia sp. NBRC 101731]